MTERLFLFMQMEFPWELGPPDGRYLLRNTLSEIERRWEPSSFVRVHRQYVANLARAVELRPLLGGTAELAFADGQVIPVARRHVGDLSRRLGV